MVPASQQLRLNYRRKAQTTHTRDIHRAFSSGNQRDFITGPQRLLLHKETLPKLVDMVDIPNTEKQMERQTK